MIITPFNYDQYFLRLFILFSSESVKVFHFCMFIFFMALQFYIHRDFEINAFIFLVVFPSVVEGWRVRILVSIYTYLNSLSISSIYSIKDYLT